MALKSDLFKNEIIKQYIIDLVGEEGYKTARYLPTGEAKSEYDVADALKININRLRSILYKFYSKNLVFYRRERDAKKGWYIYHWKFYPLKLIEQIKKEKEEKLKGLEARTQTSLEKQFYQCKGCTVKVEFEQAFINDFKCPNCGNSLELVESRKNENTNKKDINKLKKDIKELSEFLKPEKKIRTKKDKEE